MQKFELLPELEEKVMGVIWENAPTLTIQPIFETMNERYEKAWKIQTISTVLGRLRKKGFLTMYRKGREFVYIPQVTRREYLEKKLAQLTENFNVSKEDIKKLL